MVSLKLICWLADLTAQLARLCGWFFRYSEGASDFQILHSVQALLRFPLLRFDNSKRFFLLLIHFLSLSGDFKSLN